MTNLRCVVVPLGLMAAMLGACTAPGADAVSPAREVAVDHLVYLMPDLAGDVAAFTEATGVAPSYGGAHVSGGTANYLAALDARAYVEFLGPSPDRDPTARDQGAAIAGAQEEFWTFAVRVDNAAETAAALRDKGLDVAGPIEGGRDLPDASRLAWRNTVVTDKEFCEFVPFAIEWIDDARHPSRTSTPGLALARLEIAHPKAHALNAIYSALGMSIRAVESDAPSMRAVLKSPKGDIVLERKSPPCFQPD